MTGYEDPIEVHELECTEGGLTIRAVFMVGTRAFAVDFFEIHHDHHVLIEGHEGPFNPKVDDIDTMKNNLPAFLGAVMDRRKMFWKRVAVYEQAENEERESVKQETIH